MSQNVKTAVVISSFSLFILIVMLFAKVFDRSSSPVVFTSDKGRFSITFPSEPKRFTSYFASNFGSYDIIGASSDANDIEFSIQFTDFSENFPTSSDFWHEGTQVDLSKETFYSRRKTFEHNGYPVVETKMKTFDGFLSYSRQIHFHQRRFTLQAITRKDDKPHENQIQRFFNSLTFIEEPE
ncbi:MAG: hypothetical protein ACYTE8_03515 [Planctomycetota bacterium]|jgi:hypothetical protein